MPEPMSATPALDPFQQISVNQAREILAVYGDGGSEALTAHVHGGPFDTTTEGADEAYAVGVLAHHVEALLEVIDGLTADRPPLTELEVRAAEASRRIVIEEVFAAGVRAGQQASA